MKLGSIHRVRISTRDYRSILDMLEEAGISIEESFDSLAGLTLSALLEVYRTSSIVGSFTKEIQNLRTHWNIPGHVKPQEQVEIPKGVLSEWSTQELKGELERLGKLTHLVGCEQRQEAIQAILRGRDQ